MAPRKTKHARPPLSPAITRQVESDLVRASVETLADVFVARGMSVLDALQIVATGVAQEMTARGAQLGACTCEACTRRQAPI